MAGSLKELSMYRIVKAKEMLSAAEGNLEIKYYKNGREYSCLFLRNHIWRLDKVSTIFKRRVCCHVRIHSRK